MSSDGATVGPTSHISCGFRAAVDLLGELSGAGRGIETIARGRLATQFKRVGQTAVDLPSD